MFQCLIVQTDLPGERQSGTASGNPPCVPSQGMAAASSLLRRSFWAALPWMRQQQVKATGTVVSMDVFSGRLHTPRYMLPEGLVSCSVFSVDGSSSETIPYWKVGT